MSKPRAPSPRAATDAACLPDEPGPHYGQPRLFYASGATYTVISPRARGLAIGVNVNPDRFCNFDCVYCEVAGQRPTSPSPCPVDSTTAELEQLLTLAHQGQLRLWPGYASVPPECLKLREVTLSGDGEPTFCPNFDEVVHAVIRLRAVGRVPFFKLVLLTNGTGLDRPSVRQSLKHFTRQDEIWIKLDAGTQNRMNLINRSPVPLTDILDRIISLGRERDVVLQSLFPLWQGQPPSAQDIDGYIDCLRRLQAAGTRIAQVQIYSAHRPAPRRECRHASLRFLSEVARQVRRSTGLQACVF
jgi:wyosine [tRNA(Phe)-imidazoG37] synthetase (radical SAM superfamily)